MNTTSSKGGSGDESKSLASHMNRLKVSDEMANIDSWQNNKSELDGKRAAMGNNAGEMSDTNSEQSSASSSGKLRMKQGNKLLLPYNVTAKSMVSGDIG